MHGSPSRLKSALKYSGDDVVFHVVPCEVIVSAVRQCESMWDHQVEAEYVLCELQQVPLLFKFIERSVILFDADLNRCDSS